MAYMASLLFAGVGKWLLHMAWDWRMGGELLGMYFG